MKRSALLSIAVLIAGCAAAKSTTVELPVPLASASAIAVRTLDDTLIPLIAASAPSSVMGAWGAKFPKAKEYRALAVPPSARVLLTWRVGKTHVAKPLQEDEDYPANHVAPIDLVVRAGDQDAVVSLGDRSGSTDPLFVSYCAHRGFVSPSEAEVQRAPDPSVPSWFTVGIAQGSTDLMVVRDGDTLHVLHRETSDGKCDDAKQGPLDVCEGFEWERVADVSVPRAAELFETIDEEGHAFDCGAVRPAGDSLRAP